MSIIISFFIFMSAIVSGQELARYEHQSSTTDLFIHHHIQKQFFQHLPDFMWRYRKMVRSWDHHKTTHLVTIDEGRFLDAYLDDSRYHYAMAPKGEMSITLPVNFSGEIFVTGLAYNYCHVALLAALGRALLQSRERELSVTFLTEWVYYQPHGLTSLLDIKDQNLPQARTLKQLLENRELFLSVFQAQKRYLEERVAVEVLLEGQVPQGQNPALFLKMQ